jgi:hypothetical protein
MKSLLLPLLAAALVAPLLPAATQAETRTDIYNGATCIPYPPFNSNDALPYSSWLYGFRHSAFCHFPVPDSWSVKNIDYVLFEGSTPSDFESIRVRLCVYYRQTQTCGVERSMSGSLGVNWVKLPSPMPTYVTGAYLSVAFPNDSV